MLHCEREAANQPICLTHIKENEFHVRLNAEGMLRKCFMENEEPVRWK
jgi:hypothetical protein